ncbi:MAG TPA: hypothetical protein VMD02_01500 [Candidatus Omnitrophota bacterium]|nr:hypothetical protein [Candidatus Omnitrophota bacterium]
MKIKSILAAGLVLLLSLIAPSHATLSHNIEMKLDTSDGNTGMILENASLTQVATIDSIGNMFLNGNLSSSGGGSSLFLTGHNLNDWPKIEGKGNGPTNWLLGQDDYLSADGLTLLTSSYSPIYLGTNGTLRMTLSKDGYVAIGPVSTPFAELNLFTYSTFADAGLGITSLNPSGKTLTINQGAVGRLNFTEPGVDDLMTLDFNQYRVGIEAGVPELKLTLGSDGGILATGTLYSGADLVTTGSGTRLIWWPKEAAFRAGNISGSQWDSANIGTGSFAGNINTTASGTYSFAMGNSTSASATNSTAFGNHTTAGGDTSTTFGGYTRASGADSMAMGYLTTTTADYSTVMGWSTTLGSSYANSLGIGYSSTPPQILLNPSGNSWINSGSGNVGIGTTAPLEKLDVRSAINLGWGGSIRAYNGSGSSSKNILSNGWASGYGDYVLFEVPSTSVSSTVTMRISNSLGFDFEGSNVGIGTSSPASRLHVNGPIATATNNQSSNYTITANDSVIFVNANSADVTITLPAASSSTIGRVYYIYKTDASAHFVLVARNGSDTVNGTSSVSTNTPYNCMRVIGVTSSSWISSTLTKS